MTITGSATSARRRAIASPSWRGPSLKTRTSRCGNDAGHPYVDQLPRDPIRKQCPECIDANEAHRNRAAIGARVTVSTAARSQIEEVRGGSSYLSSNDQRLHFGLASDAVIDKVEIRWPNGSLEVLHNVPADAIYTIVEGEGIRNTLKLPPPEAP